MPVDNITTQQAAALDNMCPAAKAVGLGARLDSLNNAVVYTTPGYAIVMGTVALSNATPSAVDTGLSVVTGFAWGMMNIPTTINATPITATPSATAGRIDIKAGTGWSGTTNCYWIAQGTL